MREYLPRENRCLLSSLLGSCNMMFVYGMQDPWTGNRIPDDKLGKNCQILYIENGTHNDAIDTWNASERNQLFQWLKGLGFDL